MRCACQMEGPNIIYRVAPRDLGTPSRHSREGSFHLVSARSTNGRYSVPVLMTACTTRAILAVRAVIALRSEEHTSELQSLMRISYAVFCLKKKKTNTKLSEEV